MKILKEHILQYGKCLNDGILKVDSFVNHQLDAKLMEQIGEEFARRFADSGATKIVTIEASGIAPALMTGLKMGLPVLFAKKQKPSTMEGMLTTSVHSFTKWQAYPICISSEYLSSDDKILFIDDFLAYGNAALGIIEIASKAGAEIVGMGFLIEKEFQNGAKTLREKGMRVESLAIIESLDNCTIKLK